MTLDSLPEVVRRNARGILTLDALGLGVHPVATIEEKRRAIEAILSKLKYRSHGDRASAIETIRDMAGVPLPDDLMMTSEQVLGMRRSGMGVGAHTVTHPILANQSAEQQDWEISECKRRLVEELGEPVFAFSYPVGGPSSFNAFTRTSLTSHGFRLAFAYHGSFCRPGHRDLHAISRTSIETDIDQPQFRAVVTLPQLFA